MKVLERLRKVNGPGVPEDSIAFRTWVLVAVIAGEVAVLREGAGTAALWLACVVGTPAAFVFSHRTRGREHLALKVMLAVGLVVALERFVRTVTGTEVASVADVQVPLAELFLWIQLLHSLDVPARRDLMFSLASSFSLVIVGGILALDTSFGLVLLAWGPSALAALVCSHRSALAAMPPLEPVATDGESAPRARQLVPTALGIAAAIASGGLLLALLPAAGGSRTIAFPFRSVGGGSDLLGSLSNSSLGDADPLSGGESRQGTRFREDVGRGAASYAYYGFSRSMDLGVRGVRPDDTLVMRVRAPAADFWRGQTFDTWDGQTWTLSDEAGSRLGRETPTQVPSEQLGVPELLGSAPTQDFVQTFYIERPGPNVIFGASRMDRVYLATNAYSLSDGTVRAGARLPGGTVYTVVSRRPQVTEEMLRGAGAPGQHLDPAPFGRYLQLPVLPDRVSRLARSITATAPTAYDKVRALEAWIAANTRYSLDPPAARRGMDAVEQFLFEDRVGFCEQIGSSLVVLLRSLGIPARLVVGFTSGERNPFTGLYEVRGKDAHAWAEVFFPGVGWQGFDPTADVPLAGEAAALSAGSGAWSYVTRRIPAPPRELLVGVASVGGAAALWWSTMLAWRVIRNRRARRSGRSWAERSLARLEGAGARAGRARRPCETVRVYAHALEGRGLALGEDLRVVAEAIDEDGFGLAPIGDGERARADAVLTQIEAAPREGVLTGPVRPGRRTS